ncbi:hypothetical protein TNCT_227661 [Trichonephila clavata]|uniref:Uncharacterized protein n=1 Tax=Trichonephila clavata TaxID=2740835 RepID=A0A8X6HF90_TRICU|nr:hypothetical protein TNCT_227661 [Trichonephila clavata]
MPPKKSNLCNFSKEARRKVLKELINRKNNRGKKHNQRIRTPKSRMKKSKRQCDERLPKNISRNRAAREHISISRVRERRDSKPVAHYPVHQFFVLHSNMRPGINFSANSKITISAMDKVYPYCQVLNFRG